MMIKRLVVTCGLLALTLSGCHSKPKPAATQEYVAVASCAGTCTTFAATPNSSTLKATSLDNIVVGGKWNNAVDIRFAAKTNAPLAALRDYWITGNPTGKTGYASGTGAIPTYTLYSEVGGVPTTIIAQGTVTVHQISENGRGDFPLVCFTPVMLTAGTTYDIVVRNADPNYQVNYSSLDFLIDTAIANQTPDVQIWMSAQGVPWEPVHSGELLGSPIALFYADGTVQGYGYIAAGSQYPNGLEGGTNYGFPALISQ